MNKKEYKKLQKVCDFKIKEAQKRYSASPNRAEGWKEAFLCMKSILSKQFKPNIVEERPKGEWEYEMQPMSNPYCYRCSVCQNMSVARRNFCPECGAEMKGEEE